MCLKVLLAVILYVMLICLIRTLFDGLRGEGVSCAYSDMLLGCGQFDVMLSANGLVWKWTCGCGGVRVVMFGVSVVVVSFTVVCSIACCEVLVVCSWPVRLTAEGAGWTATGRSWGRCGVADLRLQKFWLRVVIVEDCCW